MNNQTRPSDHSNDGERMPKYLVSFSESPFEEQEFKIVNGSSESEAIDKFIKAFAVTDNDFLQDVYDKSVNASFAERFWMQTEDEEILFHETAQIMIGDEEFKKRVRAFFSRHRDYAERYIDYYFSDEDSPSVDPFPQEMLVYIWVNSNYSDVIAVKLDDIGEI
jgi:hypothetical protein